jgi:two-component system response regulator MprA
MSTPHAKQVILIIDDHADLLTTMRHMLESSGYEVVTASNGAEGLNTLMVRKGMVSAVIVDLYMPKLGGAHFAELIRIAWPSLPILIVSAYAEAARSMIDRLAIPVLPKPFTVDTLRSAVTAIL